MDIGATLRKIRLTNNYSHQYVADHLNISRKTYINWENNKTDLTLQKCDKICDLYSIGISGLIAYHIKNVSSIN
jgi:transcriptional regulator with XRE-family HTH domain